VISTSLLGHFDRKGWFVKDVSDLTTSWLGRSWDRDSYLVMLVEEKQRAVRY